MKLELKRISFRSVSHQKVEVNDFKGPFYSIVDDTFLVKGEKRAIFIKFGLTD